jgi:hypothetical protein
VHIDRDSSPAAKESDSQRFLIELQLSLKPAEDPPESLTKHLRAGRHLEWLTEELLNDQSEALHALVRARLLSPNAPRKVSAIPMESLKAGDHQLELRGAEFHAPSNTKDGVVRLAWVELPSSTTRIEIDFFTQMNSGADVWALVSQEADVQLRQLV